MKSLIALFFALLAANVACAGVLTPGLESMLAGRDENEVVTVLVVMRDQADPVAMDKAMFARKAPFGERHLAVVSALQRTAESSQASILAELDASKANGGIEGYTSHWIVNALVVRGTIASVRTLAARDDVERIEPDLEVKLLEPVSVKQASGFEADKAGFLSPGVAAVNAPRVWYELGIDGTGTLVANLDSGVDVTHSALGSRWRGNFAPASECWADIAGAGSPDLPVDIVGHGTHTMGTITAVTDFDTLGVAPGARWIASNGVATPPSTFDNSVIAAFEWFTDPDGDPATSDDVPDVIQNSWGVNPSLGPYLECDSRWWDVMDNCEAAGVVLTWSAGNDGPGPGTVNSPANRADTPSNSFSVGSTGQYSPFTISIFSSRGPSQCGGPFEIKPEVCAPGENILSTYPGGGYAYMDGTSMAGPHVAGVVALMRQANPDIDVNTIKQILMETARDLGNSGEDNTYGHGIIDAYAAVLTVLQDVGTVSGTVTDGGTGLPLEGCVVREADGFSQRTTGTDGSYSLTVRAGQRSFLFEKFGFTPTILEVDIPVAGTANGDLALPPSPEGIVSGIVRGPDGQPFVGATITAIGTPVSPVTSDGAGGYQMILPAYPEAAYDLTASAPGLAYDLRHIGLQGDVTQDFHLTDLQGDGFESGDFSTLPWQQGGDLPMTIDSTEAYEGLLSVRTGAIDHGQNSELLLSYYVTGTDDVSFWYMVESEAAYDVLIFSINGVEEERWSGEVPWTLYQKTLDEGLYEFSWNYRKDVSASHLRDAAWIDLVNLPGTGVQPFAHLALGTTLVEDEIDAGTTSAIPLAIGNTGGYRLDYTTIFADSPTWVTAFPETGTVNPGSMGEIILNFDGWHAPTGFNEVQLILSSNDPDHPDTTVTVNLTVNGVSDVGEATPKAVTLNGAVPNPFNPATEIVFSLPAAAEVSLKIYDASGRLVRTLMQVEMPAGRHRALWDGRDDKDRGQASGVYFARLQAAGVTEIRPMTLIR